MPDNDGAPTAGEQNPDATDPLNSQLVTLVYGQLRALAHGYLKKESRNRPLQTTALVHEAYLRLAERNVNCKDRTHFVAVAATTMRRVLVDLARERASRKRGANAIHLSLDDAQVGKAEAIPDVLILDQLMTRLEAIDPRKARAIELRIFGGLTTDEASEAIGISRATLERDLRFAKAWLGRELRTSTTPG